MSIFAFASVVIFWAAIVLALTSLLTPNAAFLCRTRTRLHGLMSWAGIAVVAGGLNMLLGSAGNTIF